ncbi:MAG: polysaccharide pyruvyl transferase family protein [Candidatus Krumholzibacteriia bacterium]
MSVFAKLARGGKQRLRERYENWRGRQYEERARRLAGRPRPHPRALVFPAAGVGSLGDEAMLMAAGRILRRHGVEQLTVLSYGPGAPWPPVGDFDDVISLGERYGADFWGTCDDVLAACATATHLLIQGADVMDGYYSPYECFRRCVYARIAAAAGLRTTIGGFSYNASPHPRSVRTLAAVPAAVRLVARDPVSWRRLVGLIGRPVHAGADMAFLLGGAVGSATVERHVRWVESQRAEGRLVLGVNANYLVAPGHREGDVGRDLIDAYAAGLAPLLDAAAPVSLLLLPHDYRAMAGRYSDGELLAAVADRLPASLAGCVRPVRERLDAAEAKALAGKVDAVISGRMHLAIAALGQGIPAAGVTYQGKFEGLYEHFGLTGQSLAPTDLLAGGLAPFLQGFLAQRAQLATTIAARLPQVQELAGVSFANLIADDEAGEP